MKRFWRPPALCRVQCGTISTVAAIQIVIDSKLLKAADRAAKRQKLNRSALIRNALKEHLRKLAQLEMEERDRRAYLAHPQRVEEYRPWEEIAAWPEE
jgi:metal-responsive CopG/Arc/MetJ family transcriptional regulator